MKFTVFKLKLGHLSNEIAENLFEQIFDHKFETLENKLISTTNKEENQIIIKSVEKNKYEIFKTDKFNHFQIRSYNQKPVLGSLF